MLTMGQNVAKICNTLVFFHFVLQEELISSKVILLPCTKLIVSVSYLLEKFMKIELENIAERRQR